MEVSRNASIGDMLDRLLANHLIDACHMTSDYITVVRGTKRHSFSYKKARRFLLGILQDGSWVGAPEVDDAQRDPPTLRAVGGTRERAAAGTEPFEPALDELLRIAADLHLIEGHQRRTGSPYVTISLSACESEMREAEAVAFLAECILYKLNEMRHAFVTSPKTGEWEEGSASWSTTVRSPGAE